VDLANTEPELTADDAAAAVSKSVSREEPAEPGEMASELGAAYRNRTDDLRITSASLFRLS
jgi:hypothetical protein